MDTGNLLLNHEYGKGSFRFSGRHLIAFKEIIFLRLEGDRLSFRLTSMDKQGCDAATVVSGKNVRGGLRFAAEERLPGFDCVDPLFSCQPGTFSCEGSVRLDLDTSLFTGGQSQL